MNISQSSWIKCRDWMAFALSHHIIMGIYLLILRNFLPQVVPDFEWQHYFMRVFIVHIIYIIISYFIRITRYPPGPPPMAVFGNSPFVNILTPEQTFLEYREIYGPIFTLHLSRKSLFLIPIISATTINFQSQRLSSQSTKRFRRHLSKMVSERK